MNALKRTFELWYWALMTVAISLILTSVTRTFGEAFFLAVMLLPGVLFVKFFSGDISFKNRRQGILHSVYFAIVVLLIEYLSILAAYGLMFDREVPRGVLLNPLFLCLLPVSLLSIERLLKTRFFTSEDTKEQYITFTSDRQRVSLELDIILYIESRDDQVLVVTVSGQKWPTRMKISQWEAVLDRRFIRVHRAWIVGRRHITRFDARAVYLGDRAIEISRKYKNSVQEQLER